MLLSALKVSGILSLFIVASVLFILKVIQKYFHLGFFKHLKDNNKLSWRYTL